MLRLPGKKKSLMMLLKRNRFWVFCDRHILARLREFYMFIRSQDNASRTIKKQHPHKYFMDKTDIRNKHIGELVRIALRIHCTQIN